MSSSMFNIEKLSEDNYESWHLQMKSVLIHQDLWEVVSDDVAAEKKDAVWKKKDEKAMATIILCISPVQLSYIKNSKTAKEAWNCLSDIHRPKGPIRKVSLFKQLLNMRMEETDGTQEYLCQFTSVVDKLAEAGIELGEDLLVIMILASLPKSFENFVVALESKDNLPKLSSLKAKLSEENERRKSAMDNDNSTTTVFMAHNRQNHNNNYTRNEHAIRQSPNNNSSRRNYNVNNHHPNNNIGSSEKGSRTSNNNNVKCYSCGGRGHYAANCKKAAKKGEHAFPILAAIDNNNINKNTWCFDSGSSSHLCCNSNLFTNFEEHHAEISLANGTTIQARGRGTVRINDGNVILNEVLFVPSLQCNFISVGRVAAKNVVKFGKKCAQIIDKGEIVLTARKVGNLFLFNDPHKKLILANAKTKPMESRYGHRKGVSLQQRQQSNLNVFQSKRHRCTVKQIIGEPL
ncbi:uncharacterized protein [Musca autumnalis]|uniref:uncharacterized protein n=1 Tax=Musca autumnalis TaxID=221902 RepID=UPI003CE76AF3